jgi:hypothetical protein
MGVTAAARFRLSGVFERARPRRWPIWRVLTQPGAAATGYRNVEAWCWLWPASWIFSSTIDC